MSLGNSFFSDFGASGGKDGTQGVQGLQGTQGLQGNRGIQGVLGARGGIGSQGIQGFGGQIGSQGIQGIQGAGSQGSQGLQGVMCEDYQIIPIAVGQTTYNGNGLCSSDTAELTITANTIFIAPCVFRQSFTTNLLSVRNNFLVAGARVIRILIYSNGTSGANLNYPETKLYESVDLDMTTLGVKSVITNLTFLANVTYWFGCYGNITGQVSAVSANQASMFMYFDQSNCQLRQAVTFGSAPTTWNVATQTYASDVAVRVGINVNSVL
jgi:hypothetical protein